MDFDTLQLLAGAGGGALAYGLTKLLEMWLKGRSRELHAQFSHSNFDTVVVSADADLSRVAEKVREAVQFEADLGKALQGSFSSAIQVESGRGTGFDFVVLSDGRRIGIEAKMNADRLDLAAFSRFLEAGKNFDKVVLVSPKKFSARVLAASEAHRMRGQIELLTVPSMDQLKPLLQKALASAPSDA